MHVCVLHSLIFIPPAQNIHSREEQPGQHWGTQQQQEILPVPAALVGAAGMNCQMFIKFVLEAKSGWSCGWDTPYQSILMFGYAVSAMALPPDLLCSEQGVHYNSSCY